MQDVLIAIVFTGIGIAGARWWQRRMDDPINSREERIQQFHERQRDEMRVRTRDA